MFRLAVHLFKYYIFWTTFLFIVICFLHFSLILQKDAVIQPSALHKFKFICILFASQD